MRYDASMTNATHDKPMMHTYTIEAAKHLSEPMKKKLSSLSLDFVEINSPTHSMFIVNQNTEAERAAVRTLGREIAAYEQKQYEKVAPQQTLEEAKKLRRMNLIRLFTLRQPLEALPEASVSDSQPSTPSQSEKPAERLVSPPQMPTQAPRI
jgi:hypothetical protein